MSVNNGASRAIDSLWERLAKISEFSFTASNGPGSATDWRGHARGSVAAERDDSRILFRERARFTSSDGRELDMQNCYRWTRLPGSLRLEHLRRSEPVLLFELQPVTEHGFREVQPHLCGADTYTAQLLLRKGQLELIWQIHGPHKNEQLHYHYW
ncbi:MULTISPECIES: DUF6314 family protein [Microbulbifer]|uniref:DUF6314 family protein n=1 Tax=Microbulbifer TaxID=48073 RepID=UPI001E35651F|nr:MULTISPECIES: DUF6314 family protein [Microbulbifer]UHQ56946.1 DUF6314 family protein [Microbulbifer sp. YPW16]